MALTIRLYSDFVCPFCFIAEQSSVSRLLREYDASIDWLGFELHPDTPRGGMPLAEKFGAARLPSMLHSIERFARGFGVEGMKLNDRLPNTRWALALAELARERGRLEEFRSLASEAHWRKGMNLEDDRDLTALAEQAGLPPSAPEEALAEPRFLARVEATAAEFERLGATAIPTFFIGAERVVGCQPYAALAAAVERAGGSRRHADAPSSPSNGAAPAAPLEKMGGNRA